MLNLFHISATSWKGRIVFDSKEICTSVLVLAF